MFAGNAVTTMGIVELSSQLLEINRAGTTTARLPTVVLVADIDDFMASVARNGPQHADYVRGVVLQAIKSALAPWGQEVSVIPFEMDEFAILLALERDGTEVEADAAAAAQVIVDRVSSDSAYTIGVGVGRYHAEADGIVVSFLEAASAIRYKLILGGNRVFVQRELSETARTSRENAVRLEVTQQIFQKLRGSSEADVEPMLQRWLQQSLSAEPPLTPGAIDVRVTDLLMQSLQVLRESAPLHVYHYSLARLLKELQLLPTLHEYSYLSFRLESYFHDVVALLGEAEPHAFDAIAKARQIIHQRFAEDLTLTSVAQEIHVSPFHLSHLFRRRSGVTFLEYLTDHRMQQAQVLLEETLEPISQVATRVGYADSRHFGRVFKKRLGVTPSQYRLRRLRGL
jgi:two-component system, response regulator YesN